MIAFAEKRSYLWTGGLGLGSGRKSNGAVLLWSSHEISNPAIPIQSPQMPIGKDPNAHRPRSEEIAAWVRIAISSTSSPEQRETVANRLALVITSIARRVAASFAIRVRQEIQDQAVAFVWLRLSGYDADKASFWTWCQAVLYHNAVDLWRSHQRQRGVPPERIANDPPPAVATLEECKQLCVERRQALDAMPREPANGAAVRYAAVLLVKLRLALAASLAREMPDDWHQPPLNRRSEFVAHCMPWRAEEEEWCFKQGWSAIRCVWENLECAIDQKPFYLTDSEFCESLSDLLGGEFPANDWQQWVRRAKLEAQRAIGQERWTCLFGDLLPDRQLRSRLLEPRGIEE